MDKHKIFIETVGRIGERHRIVQRENTDSDLFNNFSYWDGNEWTDEDADARLYYRFQEAANDLKSLKALENLEKPKKIYTAVIEIEVTGEDPPSFEELQKHLGQTAKLSLVKPPPFDGYVQLEIDWGTLQETKGRVS